MTRETTLEKEFLRNKKQLEFDFSEKSYVPSFDTWYAENSHEKRQFQEKPYNKRRALMVYKNLVETGFFTKGK